MLAAASTDQPWNFGVFGIGAVVFVILSTWLFFERRERLKAQARVEELLVDFANRIVPMLTSGLEVIAMTPEKVRQVLREASASSQRGEGLDTALEAVQTAARALQEATRQADPRRGPTS